MLDLAKRLIVLWTIAMGVAGSSCGRAPDASCPEVGFTVVEPNATSATRPVKDGTNQTLFIRREWITTTSDISEIRIARPEDGDDDDVLILLKFTQEADQRLHDATTNRSGMRIAFMFEDEVVLNFAWEGRYGMYTGGTQVSVKHGLNQAQRLLKAIRGCTPAPVSDQAP